MRNNTENIGNTGNTGKTRNAGILGRFGGRIAHWALPAFVAAVCAVTLSSCYIDDAWSPSPPSGWNDTFYDSRLTGYWKLEQVNSTDVDGYEVNYLYFNGSGRGIYYYYDDGQRYMENTAYWCQESVSGTSNYQINLQYETTGSPTTMNYWFTDSNSTLWMQWTNSDGVQTYLYSYYPSQPW